MKTRRYAAPAAKGLSQNWYSVSSLLDMRSQRLLSRIYNYIRDSMSKADHVFYQVFYSRPVDEWLTLAWRDKPITAVIHLLFRWRGRIAYLWRKATCLQLTFSQTNMFLFLPHLDAFHLPLRLFIELQFSSSPGWLLSQLVYPVGSPLLQSQSWPFLCNPSQWALLFFLFNKKEFCFIFTSTAAR